MDCVGTEWVCTAHDQLVRLGFTLGDADKIAAVFQQTWNTAWKIADRVRENSHTIAVFLSVAYGGLNWFWYRQAILHEKLEKYIRQSDAALEPAARQTIELIQRPYRRAKLRQPAYAIELCETLKKTSWGPSWVSWRSNEFLDPKIADAIDGIDNRIAIAQSALTSLRQQRAYANLIGAALIARRADAARDAISAADLDLRAAEKYQDVLKIPGHHRDVIAKEGEAFHLLRAGNLPKAETAFLELEVMCEDIADERFKAILSARAKRYRAQILQAQANSGALAALQLMRPPATNPTAIAALTLRAGFEWTAPWDVIEQAEMHYVTAYLAYRLGFGVIEQAQISDARTCYKRVSDPLPRWWLLRSAHEERLRKAADEGFARVTAAENGKRQYDLAWLFQPKRGPSQSSPAPNPAEPVAEARNGDGVPQAAQEGAVEKGDKA